MKLFKTEHAEIVYNSRKKQIVQKWKGFVPSDTFKKALEITSEFIENNDVISLISDTSEQRAVSPADVITATQYLESYYKNGLLTMAFVLPEDVFTQMSLKKFEQTQTQPQTKSNLSFFRSSEAAKKWMKNIESKII